jgi:hypothetical protein
MVDYPLTEIITMIVALIAAIWAWYQKHKKDEIVTFYTEPESKPIEKTLALVKDLPGRSWKMSPETLKWVLFGESIEDQNDLRGQIVTAESNALTSYTIRYSKGFYLIEYGLIKSSGREK